MGLFFNRKSKTKKHFEEWGRAVIDGYTPGLNISEEKLTELTGILISNDARIITESIDIAKMTNDPETRKRRFKLAQEKVKHLKTLEPFAKDAQLKGLKDAQKAWLNFNIYLEDMKNKASKEAAISASEIRKSNKDAFWDGASETMMADVFMDDMAKATWKKGK